MRPLPRVRWVVVAMLASAFIVAAALSCGSGDESAPSRGTPLQELSVKYAQGVDGKISYRYNTTNFGSHPNGTRTVYRLGNKIRDDWLVEGVTTILIISRPDFYVCTSTAFLKDCNRAREEEALNLFPWFTPIEEIPRAILAMSSPEPSPTMPSIAVTAARDETIAGTAAKCFSLDVSGRLGVGPPGSEKIKICFSERGELLAMERVITFLDSTKPGADLSLEAQEIVAAKAADFVPIIPPR